jgi:DNA-binding phage protein
MANRSAVTVVRDAIRRDNRSITRLARDAGVSQSQVSRFVSGKRGVTIVTMERLLGTLGLELRPLRRSA